MKNTGRRQNGALAKLCQKLARRMVLTMPLFMQDGVRLLYNSETNVEFCLRKLKEKGFNPRHVVDGGAYMGNWTRMVKRNFPGAGVLMIEPQQDKRPLLIQVQNEFPGTVDYVQCLLGAEAKDAVPFFENEGGGSSVLRELTHSPFKTTTVPMRTLDDLLRERKITDAALLKLDLQGYELEALRGGAVAMKNAEVILLEVSLVPFNESGPLLHEVVAFMQDRGFLVYDLSALPRWIDSTLFQLDVFFVKENSALRQVNFAAPGQPTAPRSA